MGRFDVGHNGVLEATNFGLKGIATVEKDHIATSGLYEIIDLSGGEVWPTIDYTRLINVEILRRAEGNQLVAHADRETWKIIAGAFGPFEVGVLEARPLSRGADVLLHRAEWSANGSVDAVLGDNDSTLETQAVAEGPLPQANGLRVGQWREAVVQKNFVRLHTSMLRKITLSEKARGRHNCSRHFDFDTSGVEGW